MTLELFINFYGSKEPINTKTIWFSKGEVDTKNPNTYLKNKGELPRQTYNLIESQNYQHINEELQLFIKYQKC